MFLNNAEGRLVITNLIKDLGLEGLSKEEIDKFSDMYEKMVDIEMKMQLASELSEQESKEVEALGDDAEAIANHLNDKLGINLVLVMTASMQKVKQDLLSDVSYIRGMMDAQSSDQDQA